MTNTSEGAGEALDASVSYTPADKEARTKLLELAEGAEGAVRDKLLEMAEALISPAEMAIRLADEAEIAAEAIKEKIKGMEATLKSKLDEAKAHRAAAKKLEN
jgi:hypothetical protein